MPVALCHNLRMHSPAFFLRPRRRTVVAALMGAVLVPAGQAQVPPAPLAPPASDACADPWPAWTEFRKAFVSADGRVVDPDSARGQTVSEAQAYALFFALVANDRASFERLLQWTEANLAAGDLTARLPAWQWGRRDDERWGVLDPNSAADADLWMVYALAEAGRLWRVPRYTSLAALLARRVLREETTLLPGLGPTLLPGAQGFVLGPERWKLNPSYLPLHQMRWLARTYPDPLWKQLQASALKVVLGASRKGFAPDWVIYEASRGFATDAAADAAGDALVEGSYDAIRVYLWAGLLHEADPVRQPLLSALAPMARLIERLGFPPESVHTLTGEALKGGNAGSTGFSAAVVPFLKARGDNAALQDQLLRLQAKPVRANAYYDQVLSLFALGGHEGVYRFTLEGSLVPRWAGGC